MLSTQMFPSNMSYYSLLTNSLLYMFPLLVYLDHFYDNILYLHYLVKGDLMNLLLPPKYAYWIVLPCLMCTHWNSSKKIWLISHIHHASHLTSLMFYLMLSPLNHQCRPQLCQSNLHQNPNMSGSSRKIITQILEYRML